MRHKAYLTIAATALLLASCGGGGEDQPAAESAPAAAAAPQSEAARAATIANALTANPSKTDSILAAHGVTAAQLEEMMLRIARDSVASDEYRRLTTPP